MSDGTLAGPSDARTRSESMRPTRAPRSERDGPVHGTSVFSVGAPAILLHGVGGGGGFLDEIAAFGLLGLLIAGLVFLSFGGARDQKKDKPWSRRRRRRPRR